jgi:predicted transcriptional regulator
LALVSGPHSSVAVGLEAWQDLYYRGLLAINGRNRYEITDAGRKALVESAFNDK